jgi:hypothetical protein
LVRPEKRLWPSQYVELPAAYAALCAAMRLSLAANAASEPGSPPKRRCHAPNLAGVSASVVEVSSAQKRSLVVIVAYSSTV